MLAPLSTDSCLSILQGLTVEELGRSNIVARGWRTVAGQKRVWKAAMMLRWPLESSALFVRAGKTWSNVVPPDCYDARQIAAAGVKVRPREASAADDAYNPQVLAKLLHRCESQPVWGRDMEFCTYHGSRHRRLPPYKISSHFSSYGGHTMLFIVAVTKNGEPWFSAGTTPVWCCSEEIDFGGVGVLWTDFGNVWDAGKGERTAAKSSDAGNNTKEKEEPEKTGEVDKYRLTLMVKAHELMNVIVRDAEMDIQSDSHSTMLYYKYCYRSSCGFGKERLALHVGVEGDGSELMLFQWTEGPDPWNVAEEDHTPSRDDLQMVFTHLWHG